MGIVIDESSASRAPQQNKPASDPLAERFDAEAAARAKPQRTMTFKEGEDSLRPEGSALAVASGQGTQTVKDGSFTPALIKSLNEHPAQSLDWSLAKLAANKTPVLGEEDRATSATFGNGAGREAQGSKKLAAFVANVHYADPKWHTLNKAGNEASALEGSLRGRGYTSLGIHKDLSGKQMANVFNNATYASGAKKGDHVVIHYGGHGLPQGLVGTKLPAYEATKAQDRSTFGPDAIREQPKSLDTTALPAGTDANDYMPHGVIEALALGASKLGIHVTTIIDACYSGRSTDLVREQREFAVGSEAKADAAKVGGPLSDSKAKLLGAVESLRGCKQALTRMLDSWVADGHALAFESQKLSDEDAAKLAPQKAELKANYTKVLDSLWKEFIVPRLQETLAALPADQAKTLKALPIAIADPQTMADQLDWIDEATNLALDLAKG